MQLTITHHEIKNSYEIEFTVEANMGNAVAEVFFRAEYITEQDKYISGDNPCESVAGPTFDELECYEAFIFLDGFTFSLDEKDRERMAESVLEEFGDKLKEWETDLFEYRDE